MEKNALPKKYRNPISQSYKRADCQKTNLEKVKKLKIPVATLSKNKKNLRNQKNLTCPYDRHENHNNTPCRPT